MRREYCTYLNHHSLGQALTLHASLVEHAGDFRLSVICFDETTYRVLDAMELPNLELTTLEELEAADPKLVATRSARSELEYLWTSTPSVIRYLIRRDKLDELTYLDADTYLFSSPEPFFERLGDGSVLLTPASSSPQHYSLHLARKIGLYVVQFMTFRADGNGLQALEWWRERCTDLSQGREEQGGFSDQKFLDDWTQRFDGVRNLAHPGMLGPWNIESRDVACGPDRVTVDGQPLVLYHYMGTRIYRNGRDRLAAGRFRITPDQRRWIYDPYLARVRGFCDDAARVIDDFGIGPAEAEPLRWKLQAPVSSMIGSMARARVRLAPHFRVGPYVPGGYVPSGYEADPDAVSIVSDPPAADAAERVRADMVS